MNSGCFGSEFKDFLVSIQVVDFEGKVSSIRTKDIIFGYRECNLPNNLIFLSATFECKKSSKELIRKEIERLKKLKESSQPLRVKTGGSTFKNPVKALKEKFGNLFVKVCLKILVLEMLKFHLNKAISSLIQKMPLFLK